MEFEKFIENNMDKFLDKRAAELADQAAIMREEEFSMFEITEDYSKEINASLRDGNIARAKQILDEVKTKYMQAPDGTISKKRLYTILEQVYEQIKDFEEGGGSKSLHETIMDYEEKGLFSKPEFFQKNVEEGVSVILHSITLKEQEIANLTAHEVTSAKDIERAAKVYAELKDLVKRIPDSHLDLKGKASERAMKWFYIIKQLKEEHEKPKKKQRTPEEEVQDLESRLAEIRLLKESIVTTHESINECLEKKDVAGCVKNYKKLKKLCESFPRDLPEERIALLAETLSVYEKIKALKVYKEPASKWKESRKSKDDQPLGEVEREIHKTLKEPAELAEVHESRSDPLQKMRDDITISERVIDELLSQNDIKGAMKEYTNLKMLCRHFPKEPDPQEKVSILAGALAAYDRIRKVKDSLNKRKKAADDEKAVADINRARFEEFRTELGDRIMHVKEFLAQRDSQNAIRAYAELRAFFNSYPDEPFENKKALYDDILNAHLDMALLDKDFKNKTTIQSDEKIQAIIEGMKSAKEILDEGRAGDATNILLEVKHKIILLPREEFDQKYNLMKILDEMEHKIVMTNNMQKIDAQAEALR